MPRAIRVVGIQDFGYAISLLAQTALRDVAGGMTLDELLLERERIGKVVEANVEKGIDAMGPGAQAASDCRTSPCAATVPLFLYHLTQHPTSPRFTENFMQTLIQIAIFTAGLGVLYVGAETMLKGAVRLARSFGVSPMAIGLTLVAFGTSAPELSLDLTAAIKGTANLAFGDIVGSNIANVGLIAGVAAVIRPLGVQMRLLKVEVPIAITAALALWGLSANGELSRVDGAVLLTGFVGFLLLCFRSVRREPGAVKDDLKQAAETPVPLVPVPLIETPALSSLETNRWWNGGLVVAGLTGLVVGAQLMVYAAVNMARQFGVSELLIGLTVVAVGTSLPELATSVVGALRNEADIVVANVVGSNIFNLLGILGLVALVRPLPVHAASLWFDVPVMAGFTVALVPIMLRGRTIYRGEGILLIVAYAGFIAWQMLDND